MCQTPDELPSPPTLASRLLRSSAWGWMCMVLALGSPLVWLGGKCFVASQVVVGKNSFYRVERLNHPAWLGRWIGPDRLEFLKPVRQVDLTPQKGDADAGLRWLRWQTQLSTLRYLGPTHTSLTFSLVADNCPALQQLRIQDVSLSSHDFRQISRLKQLHSLQLFNCHVTKDGFSQLAAIPKLRVIVYEHGPPMSKNVVHELTGLKNIEALILSLDDPSLETLCSPPFDGSPHLPNLQQLTLHYSTIRGSALNKLSALPKLTHLTMSETKVDDQALRQLESATNLRQLYLAHCRITDEGCKSLAKLSNLESLHLGATQITIEGVRQLTGLKHLRQLTIKQCYKIRDPSEIDTLPKSFLSRCRVVR